MTTEEPIFIWNLMLTDPSPPTSDEYKFRSSLESKHKWLTDSSYLVSFAYDWCHDLKCWHKMSSQQIWLLVSHPTANNNTDAARYTGPCQCDLLA